MGLVGFRVLWRGTDPKVFFFGILSGNKKWVLCFLREKKTRWGWGLWCTELCAAIAEGGGALVNLSHGMADLVSYRNADRDIDQVSYLFNLKVFFFEFNFDVCFKFLVEFWSCFFFCWLFLFLFFGMLWSWSGACVRVIECGFLCWKVIGKFEGCEGIWVKTWWVNLCMEAILLWGWWIRMRF